ncbi:MAG: hypothetical protein L0H59_01125 [Tomitella sp.]|nr:hypothetical protein [Tomitella sp.]
MLYLAMMVPVVCMFILSQPSRDAGLTIEEYGTWRTLVYHLCYGAPLIAAYGMILVITVRDWPSTVTVRGKATAVIVFGLCAVSLFDNIFRPFAAIFEMQHIHNSITEMRSESNDLLLLPTVAILAVLTLGPVIQRLSEWIPSAQNKALYERLQPLWEGITGAVPAVVLGSRGGDASTPRQRLWRRVVEIRDGLLVLNNYTSDLPATAIDREVADCSTTPEHDQGLRRAIELHMAIHARGSGAVSAPAAEFVHDAAPPNDVEDEAHELGYTADNWKLAGTITQSLLAERPRAPKQAQVAEVE